MQAWVVGALANGSSLRCDAFCRNEVGLSTEQNKIDCQASSVLDERGTGQESNPI